MLVTREFRVSSCVHEGYEQSVMAPPTPTLTRHQPISLTRRHPRRLRRPDASFSVAPQGSVSAAGSESCDDCERGTYANGGVSPCKVCPRGMFSAERSNACELCEEGRYTNTSKTERCALCSQHQTTKNDSSPESRYECTWCTQGFYRDDTKCLPVSTLQKKSFTVHYKFYTILH